MVIRITIIFTVLFLLISCKMKNLYQRDIRMEKNKIENLNKIRFDGYYYNLRKDHNNPKKTYITSIFFLRNGMESGISTYFESFKQFEKFLLSDDFNVMLMNNKYLIQPFLIEDDKIISQSIIGGNTFEKHMSTTIIQIESLEKLRRKKHYGLDIYSKNQEYLFKEFKDIYKVKEKINKISM